MSDRLNTKEVHEATREDGSPFARITIEYFGVSRQDLVDLERELLAKLTERLAWAEARLKG